MGVIQDRLIEKASRARAPIMAAFELLPMCNLQCKMCYVRKSAAEVQRAGGLKDGDWWLHLAKEAAEMGLCYPLITGGEPLLHPDFFEIMGKMQEMGLQISINSNGTTITRERARWLGKHKPTRINITLYGASGETYQALCGDGGAYDKVRQGVEYLKEYGVPVKFNCSVTPQNVQDLDAIVAYAREVQSPLQAATYMVPPLRRDSTQVGRNERLSPEEAARARVRMDYLQAEPEWFVGQAQRYGRFVPLEELGALEEAQSAHMACRAGLCSFWVDWRGKMNNCGMYGTAEVALEGRPFAQAWDELVERTAAVRYRPACSVCPNRQLCHPCVAMVECECGSREGRPEYVCQMNQAYARLYRETARRYYPELMEKCRFPGESRESCEL